MPQNFTAIENYIVSQKSIVILIKFAKEQDRKGDQANRNLFLKLGIVTLVTRFQVYVEGVLKEFDYKLKLTNKLNKDIPLHYRLNSIKLETTAKPFHVRLENPTEYNTQKYNEISSLIDRIGEWCNDSSTINSKFETKFPLGATGLQELKKLFRQIDGKNIFENAKFDIEKLNEILRRRHDIIHEDINHQITEVTVDIYKKFIEKVVKHIDRYLKKYLV